MQYMHTKGITDETCQNYMARSNAHPNKPEFNLCYTCLSGEGCYEVTADEYNLYTVSILVSL